MDWQFTNYIIGNYKNFQKTNYLAIFDLDGTIIKTKSGKKFYQTLDDWIYFNDKVISKIRDISKKFSIIIISNQSGISNGKTDFATWCSRVETICKEIDVPIYVMCSKSNDIYRKPHPTFFNILKDGLKVSLDSFYTGDAMGRPGDFSDTDYKFALNCNIHAYTPERIFTGKIIKKSISYPQLNITNKCFTFVEKNNEIIIMVGYPGSGKSYISKLITDKFQYKIINRDTLGTITKCIAKCEELCKLNKSIIIDNTNPSQEERKKFIDIAKKYGYYIRCFIMSVNKDISRHNNYFRRYMFDKQLVPDIVYNIYNKKYKEPLLKEGFDKIEKIIPPTPLFLEYLYYYY